MIGLLQRVRSASVEIDGETVARIGSGLLVLIGIERDDTAAQAARLLERLLGYRVFDDRERRLNRSLRDLGPEQGGLLLVPQFTLAADTSSGARPSFTPAAPPGAARMLYSHFLQLSSAAWASTQSGVFGVEMQVSLVNDGPVTFLLTVRRDLISPQDRGSPR